jgi:hypothetical protein
MEKKVLYLILVQHRVGGKTISVLISNAISPYSMGKPCPDDVFLLRGKFIRTDVHFRPAQGNPT